MFPVVCEQDVRRIGISALIDVLTVPCIQDVRGVGVTASIYMFSIPCIENIRRVGVSASVQVFAVPCVQDVRRVGVSSAVKVLSIPCIQDIRGVCITSFIYMRVCHNRCVCNSIIGKYKTNHQNNKTSAHIIQLCIGFCNIQLSVSRQWLRPTDSWCTSSLRSRNQDKVLMRR